MPEAQDRERDLERLLTFVDAVVAIAITLLVLPLVDLAGELQDGGSVAELLRDHDGELYGFALSFAVIAQLWFTQHRVLSGVVRQDPVVVRLLIVWLFAIVVLPFPTALVAQAGDDAVTKVLYIGTMTVCSACLTLMAWRIDRTPEVREPQADRPQSEGSPLTTLVFAGALALSLAVPAVGYWPLLALLLPYRARKLRRAPPA